MPKKTAVIGASTKPERYSYLATQMLQEYQHEVVPLGIKKGDCAGIPILTTWPVNIPSLDSVTLYIGRDHQPEHYGYILGLQPKRIIFNPGTENPELSALASLKGIECLEACTLVLLRTGQF